MRLTLNCRPKAKAQLDLHQPHSQEPAGVDRPEDDHDSGPDFLAQPDLLSAPDAHESSSAAEPPYGLTAGERQTTIPDDGNVMSFTYEHDADSASLDSATLMYGAEASEPSGSQ